MKVSGLGINSGGVLRMYCCSFNDVLSIHMNGSTIKATIKIITNARAIDINENLLISLFSACMVDDTAFVSGLL